MSIKRISRMRVAAPIAEYVDEEPLATRISTTDDLKIKLTGMSASGLDDARTGGNVETKSSPDTARDAPTLNRSSV